MDFPDLHKFTNERLLRAGKLLIAQPMLNDSTFSRTVIYLCEHNKQGTIGFVLNQPTNVNINDVLPAFPAPELPISHGGPVQLDTLHVLHRNPDELEGNEVANGVYWGASLESLQEYINSVLFNDEELRLFVGYSGWSAGQLEQELKDGSWLIADMPNSIVFDTTPEDVWKKAIYSLGNEYRYLLNMPVDPNLN